MTLSRHTQLENMASLLGARRTLRHVQQARQAAYLNLIGAILERPAAEIEPALAVAGLPPRLVSPSDTSLAA